MARPTSRAGEVLLQAPVPAARPAGVVVATDVFALAVPEVRAALAHVVEQLAGAFPRRIAFLERAMHDRFLPDGHPGPDPITEWS